MTTARPDAPHLFVIPEGNLRLPLAFAFARNIPALKADLRIRQAQKLLLDKLGLTLKGTIGTKPPVSASTVSRQWKISGDKRVYED